MLAHFKACSFLLLTFVLLRGNVAGQSLPGQTVKFDVPAILAAPVDPAGLALSLIHISEPTRPY